MSVTAETPVVRYPRAQIVLHWATVLLLLVSFFSHEGMKALWGAVRRGGDAAAAANIGSSLHIWVGITVLVLTLLRIVLRVVQGAPAPLPGQPRAMTVVSHIVHGLLYLVLLAIPASGVAAWFGGITDAGEVHEVLFNLALALAALHVVAALFHQFVMKDNLIARMR